MDYNKAQIGDLREHPIKKVSLRNGMFSAQHGLFLAIFLAAILFVALFIKWVCYRVCPEKCKKCLPSKHGGAGRVAVGPIPHVVHIPDDTFQELTVPDQPLRSNRSRTTSFCSSLVMETLYEEDESDSGSFPENSPQITCSEEAGSPDNSSIDTFDDDNTSEESFSNAIPVDMITNDGTVYTIYTFPKKKKAPKSQQAPSKQRSVPHCRASAVVLPRDHACIIPSVRLSAPTSGGAARYSTSGGAARYSTSRTSPFVSNDPPPSYDDLFPNNESKTTSNYK